MRNSLQRQKDYALEKGRRNEERFFEAMNDPLADNLPRWIQGVLRPTSSQDRFEGIDAIVKTADVGKLFVQIKSSKAGEEKFLKGKYNKSIIVVVIGKSDTPAEIRAKARKPLSELRFQYLKLKSSICNK